MREMLRKLSDKALALVVGEAESGACIPPETWTECHSGVLYNCFNNCAGETFCNWSGDYCYP